MKLISTHKSARKRSAPVAMDATYQYFPFLLLFLLSFLLFIIMSTLFLLKWELFSGKCVKLNHNRLRCVGKSFKALKTSTKKVEI